MTRYQRISLYLTPQQVERLKQHSNDTNYTQTEIIRRAIDDYIDRYNKLVNDTIDKKLAYIRVTKNDN